MTIKIVDNENLSELHKHTQGLAKNFANQVSQQIIDHIKEVLNEDEKFGELNYSGIMTFLNTINTHIFIRLFNFTCILGRKFKDSEHCSPELFEETVEGLRVLLEFKKVNNKEYDNGIKKI